MSADYINLNEFPSKFCMLSSLTRNEGFGWLVIKAGGSGFENVYRGRII